MKSDKEYMQGRGPFKTGKNIVGRLTKKVVIVIPTKGWEKQSKMLKSLSFNEIAFRPNAGLLPANDI